MTTDQCGCGEDGAQHAQAGSASGRIDRGLQSHPRRNFGSIRTAPTSQSIAQKFHLQRAPTLFAQTDSSVAIAFTRLLKAHQARGITLGSPPEEAFVFHVMLAPRSSWDIWIDGRHKRVGSVAPGDTILLDLTTSPAACLTEPFDNVRFYISQSTIDELAYDRGFRRIGGLRAHALGAQDAVLHGLAKSLQVAIDQPNGGAAIFAEYVALAFHTHVIHAYGSVSNGDRGALGGLAPWQIRRASAFLEANLAGNPTLAQLARECGVSCSHFARAFKESMGLPPHRWLTKMRIDRAKDMISHGDLDLAEIALICGFVDQSHMTRTFSRFGGHPPGRWRRLFAK
jgi:AraC family transcriptional regulator